MADRAARSRARTWFGHPPGLSILFLTETSAYFSAFGMQALLVLYMVQSLGFDQAKASMIYGLYVGGANLTPLLGGWIADRLIGQHRAVTAGALLMAAGHAAMIWDSGLYLGLALVALGNGFFITSLVSRIGALYQPDDPRRDRAYMIYYLGINLGSFLAPLTCGWMALRYGWHVGFGAAAVVMVAGLVFYLACQPLVRAKGGATPAAPVSATDGVTRPVAARAASNVPVMLVAILAVVVLFRLGYEQMGNTIALWIDRDVDRNLGTFLVPTPWFQSLNPLFIFLLSPLLVILWRRRDERGRSIPPLRKMATGAAFAALAFLALMAGAAEGGGSVPIIYVLTYFLFMTIAELHVFPIGLALIGRFSASGNSSTMIGVWYSLKFIAGISAGLFGTLASGMSMVTFFAINLALAVLTIALMVALYRLSMRYPGPAASQVSTGS